MGLFVVGARVAELVAPFVGYERPEGLRALGQLGLTSAGVANLMWAETSVVSWVWHALTSE